MSKLKGIKKLVSYGVINLIGFSLFIGCEHNNPFGPVVEYNEQLEEISPIIFSLDSRLEIDANGYHHLDVDTSSWQTTHRISGSVSRDGNPVNVVKFVWSSSHYWIIGDNFGYVIANNGLTDDMTYVGYDTTFINWFGGNEVPIVNGSSYSREDGEINIMVAPVKTMIGDTAKIFYGYHDNWTGEETFGNFDLIFD